MDSTTRADAPDSDRPSASPSPQPSMRAAPGDLDRLCIDTIRTLSMDAVQKAKSGHPGTPMALAPVGYAVWQRFLNFDPSDCRWPNRDRFVLSNGHASMLLYSLLYLADVHSADPGAPAPVTLGDIERFRQLGSACPGHPEYGHTAGVETTTGPLGQGCGISVGMAMAERWLAATFNRPGFAVADHDVFVMCSDGDMMEGISHEAASLAGHLKLDRLCWIYDNNTITIDGHTGITFSDDVALRFQAYGWRVEKVADANDLEAMTKALQAFRDHGEGPTLIVVDSLIGYGAPHKQNTSAAHGEPLGEEEVRLAKKAYGWPEDAFFRVPDGVRAHFAEGVGARGQKRHADWRRMMAAYAEAHPDLARAFDDIVACRAQAGWDVDLKPFAADAKGAATRESSGKVLSAIAAHWPWLVSGAADLAASTKTDLAFPEAGDFTPTSHAGRNLHFGIREHAMGAAINGLALSGLRPIGSTFLIFSDYMKPAIRLSALMGLPSVFVFTHDSIGLGQDGPTHQSVEQLVGLRAIPGLIVLRPADANEVVEAWRVIGGLKDKPTCLVLSRQALPTVDRERFGSAAGLARGGYVLAGAGEASPAVILIASGSEVDLCLKAYEKLEAEGVFARVVSLPSWELFEAQDEAWRNTVLPPGVLARVSVEAASVIGWDRYAGPTGRRIGMETFGASAPAPDLMKHFGFTVEAVVAAAHDQIARQGAAAVARP